MFLFSGTIIREVRSGASVDVSAALRECRGVPVWRCGCVCLVVQHCVIVYHVPVGLNVVAESSAFAQEEARHSIRCPGYIRELRERQREEALRAHTCVGALLTPQAKRGPVLPTVPAQ